MLSRTKHKFWAACVSACFALPVGAQQPTDMQSYAALKAQLSDMHRQLSRTTTTMQSVADLPALAQVFLTGDDASVQPLANELGALPPANIEMIDLRIALLQLAFAVGGNDQIPLVRAQNVEHPQVVGIQSGSIDLDALKAWAADQPDDIFDGDTLRMPVVIFQDARLDIEPGNTLHLSREDGAFVVNLGQLRINQAIISATTAPNNGDQHFAPFVTTVGTGMAQVSSSVLENLGFGSTIAFSGLSVVNRGLYAARGPSFLENNVLRDVKVVGFDSTEQTVVVGNVFIGENAGSLDLRGVQDANVAGNIFVDTQDGGALLVTEGSDGVVVSRNVIVGSAGTGIIVNKGSHNAVLSDNVVWNSGGSGITVSDADCGYLTRNIAIDNRRKGVELRTSQGSTIAGNNILRNRSSGLFISDQPQGTDTVVHANRFVGNRIGLASASAGHVHLLGNDFSNQFPRFLDGDFAAESAAIMSDLRGAEVISLTASGVTKFANSPATCTYGLEG